MALCTNSLSPSQPVRSAFHGSSKPGGQYPGLVLCLHNAEGYFSLWNLYGSVTFSFKSWTIVTRVKGGGPPSPQSPAVWTFSQHNGVQHKAVFIENICFATRPSHSVVAEMFIDVYDLVRCLQVHLCAQFRPTVCGRLTLSVFGFIIQISTLSLHFRINPFSHGATMDLA